MNRSSFLVLVVAVVSLGQPSSAPGQPSLLENPDNQVQAGTDTGLSDLGGQTAASPTASEGIFLGLIGDDVTEGRRGVRVQEVRGKGPAERGGLRARDLITAIGNRPVGNLIDMDEALRTNKPGDKVTFKVERDGKTLALQITLGKKPQASAPDPEPSLPKPGPKSEPPLPKPKGLPDLPLPDDNHLPQPSPGLPPIGPVDPAPAPPPLRDVTPAPAEGPVTIGKPSLGVTVKDVTPALRASQGLGASRGALVTAVRPGSPAQVAGIPAGAVIIAVNGRLVNSADDLVTEIRAAQPDEEVDVTYLVGKAQRHALAKLTASRPAPSEDIGPSTLPPVVPGVGPLPGGLDVELPGAADVAAPPAMTEGAVGAGELKQAIAAMRSQIQLLQQRLSELEARLETMEKPNR